MHLLRNIFFVIILSAMPFFFSYKAKGSLSPEEAFASLKSAYLNSDAGSLENLLSGRSKEKIKTIIAIISSMNESQLKALSERFNANIDNLKNLSIKDYLSMQISQSKKSGSILKEITKHKIIGIDEKDTEAVVRIENGMEIYFVKEGPYWKFDMEELSSKNY